jgi:predicted nucleic acid-binding protein
MDPAEQTKAMVAHRLLDCVVSIQVLQEFHVQATRPKRVHRISHSEALGFILSWRRFETRAHDRDLFNLALEICQRLRFSYWDSAIVAAALMTNCDTLYTEDLQHGQVIDHITVVNPFVTA